LVGPVGVVEVLVLAQRVEQVLLVPDQRSLEKLTAAAVNPALHDRVHVRPEGLVVDRVGD
jgi:hypothetical protein